jgi:hypothetical protein
METPEFGSYVMQPRINLRRSLVTEDTANASTKLATRECRDSANSNTCEKPVDGTSTKLPIILGIVLPLVALVGVLLYLHRRNLRRQRQEEAKDPNMHLDFGLDMAGGGGKKKRKSLMFGAGEKQMHKPGQLSMDMNLSSPYLLPPGAHQSRESLHSLARTLQSEQDPYRHIQQYANSDAGSIRSFPRDPSLHNKRISVITAKSVGTVRKPAARTNSIPVSPVSPENENPFPPPTAPQPTQPLPAYPVPASLEIKKQAPAQHDDVPQFDKAPQVENSSAADELHMGSVQQPPIALAKNIQDRPSRPSSALSDRIQTGNNDVRHDQEPAGLGLNFDFPKPSSPLASPPAVQDNIAPQIQTSTYYEDDVEDYDRGRSTERQSRVLPEQGLAVPNQSNKRLSVGFRPLPPDEVTSSEDPEYRANRIRSFYKEYFDDSNDAPPPPMPGQPQARGNQEYYEDYDAGYLGEAAYYDADSNAFVMPYAQPVTRRAMTPPPAGRSRGPGGPAPFGPPRPFAGAMRSMSPGPNRPRAGSMGPRGPPSQYSSRAPSSLGPRPDSSASARGPRQAPKKRGPPPTALHTLPTPAKLKDDSFAIINAGDFAPPESFRDHVAGRSQSPLGERRPYHSPSVPVASPLVTAFDELAALPSPHLLRKSSTFTNLDFAPPKKFKDSDTMSDAGSIRSNRSGISQAQLSAIRGGAGRVSRLPGDTVFTTAAMQDELKPKWGMRP